MDPTRPVEALLGKAADCFETGDTEGAERHCRQILAVMSGHGGALHLLALVYHQQGNLVASIAYVKKAIAQEPSNSVYYNSLGNLLEEEGKLDEAISAYERALELNPQFSQAHNNLGITLEREGKLDRAVACYGNAVALNPQSVVSYTNLANALSAQGKDDAALAQYQNVLRLNPRNAQALNNMGNIFRNKGSFREAVNHYQKALALRPDYALAYDNLGKAYYDLGEFEKAMSCYRKALEIAPGFDEACKDLVHQAQRICAWEDLRVNGTKLDQLTDSALKRGKVPVEPPFLCVSRHMDPARDFAVARSWSDRLERSLLSCREELNFKFKRVKRQWITIGYLSNDFRDHPVGYLTAGWFGMHNRDDFKIFSYSYGRDDGSEIRRRIETDSDKFVDLRRLSDMESAQRIYKDEVDILVDLTGYTEGNRLTISALRCAPVQVSYLGFPGTTGGRFFDYVIVDKTVAPEDHATHYVERFVYMPECYLMLGDSVGVSQENWTKIHCGLPEKSFVFCSFNSPYKIEPEFFDAWMRVLNKVPHGILWLRSYGKTTEENLCREAENRGVSRKRLFFAERLPSKADHLGRLAAADLALDTRVYNGHVTTLDALRAGLPVITVEGKHFASRASSSMLKAAGLPEMVTDSVDQYETLAISLAHRSDELQAIREKLKKNSATKPLFKTIVFTRNLESAYQEMWQRFLEGKQPQVIEVRE